VHLDTVIAWPLGAATHPPTRLPMWLATAIGMCRRALRPHAAALARTHQELANALSALDESYMATLECLAAAVDARDPSTYGHCRRVAELVSILAMELGLEGRERQALVHAALLHDIGKLGIPDSTLRKTTTLTREDSVLIRQHPEIGYRMLERLRFLGDGLSAIRYHHERFDGTGYPFGLAGERIPLVARILAVADAYDAITSDRPYRRSRSRSQGIEEIVRCAGTHFDPAVVAAFVRAIGHATSTEQGDEDHARVSTPIHGRGGRPTLTLVGGGATAPYSATETPESSSATLARSSFTL